MVDVTPFLPGLSPVQGKAVVARFDGGRLSSEGGLLALREIERSPPVMKTATMPICCVPTRCSSWRWIGCPRMKNCVRNRSANSSVDNRILRPINGLRYTRQLSCLIRANSR